MLRLIRYVLSVPFFCVLLAFGASLACSEIRWRYLIGSDSRFGNIETLAPLVVVLIFFIYQLATRKKREAVGTVCYSVLLLFPVGWIWIMTNFNIDRATWHEASTQIPGTEITVSVHTRSLYGGRWTWIPGPPGGDWMHKVLLEKDELPKRTVYLQPVIGGSPWAELYTVGSGEDAVLRVHTYREDCYFDLKSLSTTRQHAGKEQWLGKFDWRNDSFRFSPHREE